MKRNALLAAIVLLVAVSAPRRSEAKLIEIWGSGLLGGAVGDGETDRDFFSWAGGGAAGAEVGAKLLFISAYFEYLRFFGGETGANLVSFNLGGDGSIGLAGGLSLVLRLAGAFYIGTLDEAQVKRDNIITTKEVQTRGIGVRGGAGLRYTFAKVFSVGATPQLGYHYFFGGADEDVTDTAKNSSGWDLQVMGYFRVGLGI